MEYYSAIKRNKIGSFVDTWMDLESVIQSEVSQKEKSKYRIITHLCGIQKKIRNTDFKRYIHPNVHSSTTYNSQDMETIQVSINRQLA